MSEIKTVIVIETTSDGKTFTIHPRKVSVDDLPERHPRVVMIHTPEEISAGLSTLAADAIAQYYIGFRQSDAAADAKDGPLWEYYSGTLRTLLQAAKEMARGFADDDRKAGVFDNIGR